MRSDNIPLMIKILIVLIVLVSICIFFVNGVSNLLNEENVNHNREISEQNAAILTNKINHNILTLEVLAKFISSYEHIT